MLKNIVFCLFFFTSFFSIAQNAPKPVLIGDKTLGGDTIERMYIVKNINDVSYIWGGTSWSGLNGDKNLSGKGMSDFWIVMTDTSGKNVLWQKTFGGDKRDELKVLESTRDGGFILGGASESGITADKSDSSRGGFDYWVVKIDGSGNKQWEQTFGGPGDDFLEAILQTSGNGYLLGGYSISDSGSEKSQNKKGGYDYWIVKTDVNGQLISEKTIGGTGNDFLSALEETKDQVIIGGTSNSGANGDKSQGSKGGFDFWVVGIDFKDSVLWDKTIGGSGDDNLRAIKTQGGKRIMLFGDSNSPAGGDRSAALRGADDFWMVLTDSAGQKIRDNAYGAVGNEVLSDVIAYPNNDYLLGGYSNSLPGNDKSALNKGGFDYWAIKVDSTGGVVWDESFGGSGNDLMMSMDKLCDNSFIAGGWSSSPISGDKTEDSRGVDDYWFIKTLIKTSGEFSASTVCLGEPSSFKDLSKTYPDKWSWFFGDPSSDDANFSDVKLPVHSYLKEGIYKVMLIVSEGCSAPDTATKDVIVKHNPLYGKVNLGVDREICFGETASIEVSGLPAGTSIEWSTGDTTPSITVDTAGRYTISATNSGCTVTHTVLVDDCPEIYAPNAFTPNGDGKNDKFYIYGVGIHYFDLRIYDRWGERFYISSHQSEGWDGTLNGYRCQEDVYVWFLIYKGVSGLEHKRAGSVTLIR